MCNDQTKTRKDRQMNQDVWTREGDVSDCFQPKKNKRLVKLMATNDVKIERHLVNPGPDPLDGFVDFGRDMRIGKFRITFKGKVVKESLEMPRDVWHVLRGIAIGMEL